MSQPSPYSSQLVDAQDALIRRLRQIRCCGIFNGELVVLNDDGQTQTSFSLQPGQTLGEALDEVDRRYQEAAHAPA